MTEPERSGADEPRGTSAPTGPDDGVPQGTRPVTDFSLDDLDVGAEPADVAAAGGADPGGSPSARAISPEDVDADVIAAEADDGAAPGGTGGVANGGVWDGVTDGATRAGPHPESDLAAERLADLQRLQAEYVNYKRRVDRDRAVVQERVVHDVLESLLPVLDDIQAARDHGDLATGPFAAIADKLEVALGRYGLERFGVKGESFDPARHEALMHAPWPDGDPELSSVEAGVTTVVTVLQPGYRAGEYVLRPARVAVADSA